ncbi:hypothetical protein FJT64_002898 [Amphibalanus amphitrite]|uniref:Uncharacterized protein n=1 Tax=Amphibalanus amphitrite TaxID=1232801 RepID=A0A6A4WHU8_AMPAM|nr:hypothetical protein FJT64_002898 [Amphibalanus amphitrite]
MDIVYRLGSAWVRWRNSAANIEPGWPVCNIQRFDRQLTEQCMERRLRARGRPFQAVLIGDSRVRELFLYAAPRLGAVHEVVRGADNCWERLNRTYAAGERRHGRDHWCSFARRGRLANVTYLVRHHLDQRYLESVQTLVSQCRRGLCPDLVLLNGGLHEMWRHYGRQWAVGVRALAEQAARLAPLLSWLARRGVTVLWPLIDPPMEDAGGGLVRMTPELGWLMNAALVSELGRLPGLRLCISVTVGPIGTGNTVSCRL